LSSIPFLYFFALERPRSRLPDESGCCRTISGKLGCAQRSVERKLKVIRSLWDHAEG
jgi:hypothetical protein